MSYICLCRHMMEVIAAAKDVIPALVCRIDAASDLTPFFVDNMVAALSEVLSSTWASDWVHALQVDGVDPGYKFAWN